MKMYRLAWLVAACWAPLVHAQQAAEPYAPGVRAELGVMLPMRDGVRLATDLYFPAAAEDKLPVILWRTVYSRHDAYANEPFLADLVAHGYVAVVQETRGRGDSEGDYVPTIGDRNDGYDTVEWLTRQPWSNQKLGTAGCSALGEAQLLLAATRHPHHLAMLPMTAASGYNVNGRPWSGFNGGAFELAQTAGWFAAPQQVDYRTLPVVDVLKKAGITGTSYEDFASSRPEGEYYRSLEWLRPGEVLDVPALFFDSWYDYGAAETLLLFNALRTEAASERARNNQFVIITPGTHCHYLRAQDSPLVGARDLGDFNLPVRQLVLDWFDHWLKGVDNGVTRRPKVQYYTMGKNAWQSSAQWPPAGMQLKKMYLASEGKANSRLGNGSLSLKRYRKEPADTFVYDPANPVPSLGGHACCTGTDTESGAYDQSEIELREDVLVYTSKPLKKGLEVTGPVQVVLKVSSTATDTDFTAKLIDVYPDGRAFNVQEGALRMRYRKGYDQDLRMKTGVVYTARINLHTTSNYFAPGHRIRLEISSSNFPRWDRNLNTGGNNFDESEWMSATNSVHHSKDHASYILLPVVE